MLQGTMLKSFSDFSSCFSIPRNLSAHVNKHISLSIVQTQLTLSVQ